MQHQTKDRSGKGVNYPTVPTSIAAQGLQESLAEVSARQQCVYEAPSVKSTANQHKEHNLEKYIQWAAIPSLTIRVYLHLFSRCWLPNMRNPAKFRENSSL